MSALQVAFFAMAAAMTSVILQGCGGGEAPAPVTNSTIGSTWGSTFNATNGCAALPNQRILKALKCSFNQSSSLDQCDLELANECCPSVQPEVQDSLKEMFYHRLWRMAFEFVFAVFGELVGFWDPTKTTYKVAQKLVEEAFLPAVEQVIDDHFAEKQEDIKKMLEGNMGKAMHDACMCRDGSCPAGSKTCAGGEATLGETPEWWWVRNKCYKWYLPAAYDHDLHECVKTNGDMLASLGQHIMSPIYGYCDLPVEEKDGKCVCKEKFKQWPMGIITEADAEKDPDIVLPWGLQKVSKAGGVIAHPGTGCERCVNIQMNQNSINDDGSINSLESATMLFEMHSDIKMRKAGGEELRRRRTHQWGVGLVAAITICSGALFLGYRVFANLKKRRSMTRVLVKADLEEDLPSEHEALWQ